MAPSGTYDVLGQLVAMAGRLSQALDQLESGIRGQYEAGRLHHDRGGPVGESVAALELALADTRCVAEALRDDLSRAQSAIAYVALAEGGEE